MNPCSSRERRTSTSDKPRRSNGSVSIGLKVCMGQPCPPSVGPGFSPVFGLEEACRSYALHRQPRQPDLRVRRLFKRETGPVENKHEAISTGRPTSSFKPTVTICVDGVVDASPFAYFASLDNTVPDFPNGPLTGAEVDGSHPQIYQSGHHDPQTETLEDKACTLLPSGQETAQRP